MAVEVLAAPVLTQEDSDTVTMPVTPTLFAGAGKALFVGLSIEAGAADIVSATYDGNDITLLQSAGGAAYAFYYLNPTTDADLVITFTTSVSGICLGCLILKGVDQTDPIYTIADPYTGYGIETIVKYGDTPPTGSLMCNVTQFLRDSLPIDSPIPFSPMQEQWNVGTDPSTVNGKIFGCGGTTPGDDSEYKQIWQESQSTDWYSVGVAFRPGLFAGSNSGFTMMGIGM